MSQILDLQITCPRCGTEFEAKGHTIVDTANEADAEALWQLQNGSLNMAECPNCKASGLLPIPVLYHDAASEMVLGFVPGSIDMNEEEMSNTLGAVLQNFIEGIPEEKQADYLYHLIVTDDQEALIAAARGEISRDQLLEHAELEEDEDGEEVELTPEEQAEMNRRVELIQQLFETTDSLQRIGLLRQNKHVVDDIFQEMLAVIVMQAEQSQPDLMPLLQKLTNEVEVFRASNND